MDFSSIWAKRKKLNIQTGVSLSLSFPLYLHLFICHLPSAIEFPPEPRPPSYPLSRQKAPQTPPPPSLRLTIIHRTGKNSQKAPSCPLFVSGKIPGLYRKKRSGSAPCVKLFFAIHHRSRAPRTKPLHEIRKAFGSLENRTRSETSCLNIHFLARNFFYTALSFQLIVKMEVV